MDERTLARGARLARYQIVELLGSGGVGHVYRAHDPHMSRDVALKVLHRRWTDDADSDYSDRLLQEGQALAKLSHPNVVAAYDVGTHDDEVFVAMELVAGESLDTWLRTKRRPAEVLRVLIAAGRGLVAAHAAGVTHRDFKPANVMVSPDGRPRIVDFGLARRIGINAVGEDAPSADEQRTPAFVSAASLLPPEPTETEWLRGTPGYIAPELMNGEPSVDTRADQYSYAVTVFVALTGKGPYPGSTMPDYRTALAGGQRSAWPRSVPRRIRRVVERGLAARPEDRYPSLRELVDALERAGIPRRQSAALLALALGISLLVGTAFAARGRASRAICKLDAAPFAGVWDADRRAQLERALLSTRRPNAREAFGLLSARLDAFQADWLAIKHDSCEATYVRGEQTEQVLAVRNACLGRKLEGVQALVTAFGEADERAVDRAAGALPDSTKECADTATLMGVADKLPAEPEARAAVLEIESGFAVVKALIAAGRDARAPARQWLESARASGHQLTIAHAVTWLARALNASAKTSDERKQGEAMLVDGMRLASQVGDNQLLAKTASSLFANVSFRERRAQDAEAMLPMVDALVSLAGDDPEQRIEVLIGQAFILAQRGKYADAIRVFEQAIALSPRVDSERRGYGAYAEGQIGYIDLQLHRYPEAVRRMQAEVDGIRKDLGAQHPRVILSLTNLGLAQAKAGLRDAAWSTVATLRELVALLVPAGDWRFATIAFVEGNIWENAGDCQRALPLYRDAHDLVRKYYGAAHATTADLQERLGSCLQATGQAAEAITLLEQALKIRRDLGAAPNAIAETAFQLARVLWSGAAASERPRAIALAEEALSLWRRDDVTEPVRTAQEWLSARQPVRAEPADSSPLPNGG